MDGDKERTSPQSSSGLSSGQGQSALSSNKSPTPSGSVSLSNIVFYDLRVKIYKVLNGRSETQCLRNDVVTNRDSTIKFSVIFLLNDSKDKWHFQRAFFEIETIIVIFVRWL